MKNLLFVGWCCVISALIGFGGWYFTAPTLSELDTFFQLDTEHQRITYENSDGSKYLRFSNIEDVSNLSKVYDVVTVKAEPDSSYTIIAWINRYSTFAKMFYSDKIYHIDIPYARHCGEDVELQVIIYKHLMTEPNTHLNYDK